MEKEQNKIKKDLESNSNKIVHLGFIEDAITKMTQYSISFKEWTVGIIVALFALTVNKDINKVVLIVTSVAIIIVFMVLDMYYLWQERKFRILYDLVRNKKEKEIDFSMSTNKPQLKEFCKNYNNGKLLKILNFFYTFCSPSIWAFYSIIALVCVFLFLSGAKFGGGI